MCRNCRSVVGSFRIAAIATAVGVFLSLPVFAQTHKTPPTITGISPQSGVVGTIITVTGTNFTAGATSVSFPATESTSVNSTNVNVLSATSLTAQVPSTATSGPVSVISPAGTAVSCIVSGGGRHLYSRLYCRG